MRPMRHMLPTLALLTAAALTACSSGDDGGTSTDASADASADAGDAISVTAGDLYFEPTELAASAGTVSVELVNEGDILHNFVIEEAGDTNVAEAAGGATASGSIELEQGTYTFYCDVPGHRSAMEGTLEVS